MGAWLTGSGSHLLLWPKPLTMSRNVPSGADGVMLHRQPMCRCWDVFSSHQHSKPSRGPHLHAHKHHRQKNTLGQQISLKLPGVISFHCLVETRKSCHESINVQKLQQSLHPPLASFCLNRERRPLATWPPPLEHHSA